MILAILLRNDYNLFRDNVLSTENHIIMVIILYKKHCFVFDPLVQVTSHHAEKIPTILQVERLCSN